MALKETQFYSGSYKITFRQISLKLAEIGSKKHCLAQL